MHNADAIPEQVAERGARGGQVAGVVGQVVDDAAPNFAGARQELGGPVVAQLRELALCGGYVAFGGEQLGLRAGGDDARLDRGHEVGLHALGVGQASAGTGFVGGGALECRGRGSLELLEGDVAEQVPLDGGQQCGVGALDLQAHARGAGGVAAVLVPGTAVVAIDDHHGAVAVAAAKDAAQQVAGRAPGPAALFAAGALDRRTAHARLGRVPRRAVDDGQLGCVGDDPLALGAVLAHAPAGFRMLHPVAAVPDLAANVDGVGEDADAAALVGVDGGHGPGAAARGGHAVAVEVRDDLARAAAGDVLGEDAAHDGGLRFVDRALADFGDAVAVGQATGAGAGQGAAGEAAVGLFGQVVQVQLGHEAAQAHVRLVILAGGVHAIAHADEAHTGERKALHRAVALGLVAREARDVVHQQHVEGVRLREHAQVAGAIAARAADRRVGVDHGRGPALPLAVGAAVAQLVVQAGIALVVAGVAGVGGGAHDGRFTQPCEFGATGRDPSARRFRPHLKPAGPSDIPRRPGGRGPRSGVPGRGAGYQPRGASTRRNSATRRVCVLRLSRMARTISALNRNGSSRMSADLRRGMKSMALVVAGAVVGALAVMFLVYPPAPGWGSDAKWGDIATWISSAATFLAVFAAMHIANRDRRERAIEREADQRDANFRAALSLQGAMATLHALAAFTLDKLREFEREGGNQIFGGLGTPSFNSTFRTSDLVRIGDMTPLADGVTGQLAREVLRALAWARETAASIEKAVTFVPEHKVHFLPAESVQRLMFPYRALLIAVKNAQLLIDELVGDTLELRE